MGEFIYRRPHTIDGAVITVIIYVWDCPVDMDRNVHVEINKGGLLAKRMRSYPQGWTDPVGEGKPPPRVARIISQDYETIKRKCLAQGALWEDPSFPEADSKSHLQYEWKRPGVS